jgi:hypothetical protein
MSMKIGDLTTRYMIALTFGAAFVIAATSAQAQKGGGQVTGPGCPASAPVRQI